MKPANAIIFTILILIIPWSVFSQWNEWTDPFPLTDSLTDNLNPYLHHTWLNEQEMVFMVWEKPVDSISTEIWMDNILDEEPASVVLSAPGVKYSHPKIMGDPWGNYGNALYYLFYQTNENGNEDIYFVPYGLDGTWGGPEAVTDSPNDDAQLSVSREMFYDATYWIRGLAAWISGDDLYACFLQYDGSFYLDEPVLIDSGVCSAPSVGLDYIYGIIYSKLDSNAQHIYKAGFNTTWNPPEVFFDSLESVNPTAASYYGHPAWSVKTDSNWRIMIIGWNEYNIYDLSSPEPFDPAVLGVFLGVKSWFPEILVAVEYPEDSVVEIFMTEEMGSGNFVNFSNSGTDNQHPQFFFGESYPYNFYCWYDYLVWESMRNGHWQIWSAKFIQCGGGIEEEEENAFIKVYPNPFRQETIIEFTLNVEEVVEADVFDNYGRHVTRLAYKTFSPGEHQLRWEADGLSPGIYLLHLKISGRNYSTRILKK
ncbi:MAG TPA: T9SS type A sorting domain-containing protein [Bacteroidales bacterium]|nr:T9SS type A sorting domain-containing protein [Bacteroidales bacterium]